MCMYVCVPFCHWLSISTQIILFHTHAHAHTHTHTHTYVPQTLNHTIICIGILSASGKPADKAKSHKNTQILTKQLVLLTC